MKRVILFCFLILSSVFLGNGQELDSCSLSGLKYGVLPSSVLLGDNYLQKAKYWKQLSFDNILQKLKSNSGLNKLDSIITKSWQNELQDFENDFKYEYFFNEESRNVRVSVSAWDSVKSKWTNAENVSFLFNSSGSLEQVDFVLDFGMDYYSYTRVLYNYQDSFLLDETTFFRYEETDPWDVEVQTAYFYDENGRLKRVKINDWDYYEEVWTDDKKSEYSYDENGNVILRFGYSWGGYSKVWFKKEQTEYAYDEWNNLIETIDFVPGWESDDFIGDYKETRSYGDNNELIEITKSSFSYDMNDWLQNEKIEFIQGDSEVLSQTLLSLWDIKSGGWLKNSKEEFITINGFKIEDVLHWDFIDVYMPVYSFDSEVCDLIENSDWINNEWKQTSITNYFFSSEVTTGIPQEKPIFVRVYPNPVKDILQIELENSELTNCIIRDISGRMVLEKQIWQNEQLNLSTFKPGMYFIELRQRGTRIYAGKVLKTN